MSESASSEKSLSTASHVDALTRLRAMGDTDAVLGLERVTEVLLREMVARQQVLSQVGADIRARRDNARIVHDRTLAQIRQTRSTDLDQAKKSDESARTEANTAHATASDEIRSSRASKLDELQNTCENELARLQRSLEESLLMAEAMREAGEDDVKASTRELNDRLRAKLKVAADLEAKAKVYLKSCRLKVPSVSATATDAMSMPAEAELDALLLRGEEHLTAMYATRAARLLSGVAPMSIAIVIGAGVGHRDRRALDKRVIIPGVYR